VINLLLQELHWLPVRRRVDFKMATLVYLSLSGIAPAYLATGCHLVVVSCVLPHRGRVLWDEPTATTEAGVLQLQVWSCGTAFQLNWDKLTLAFNDLSDYWRQLCSDA